MPIVKDTLRTGTGFFVGSLLFPYNDFIRNKPMKNYRIKKETYGNTTKYYPQEKFLFWWLNIFAFDVYFDGGYNTLEKAQKQLCEYCRGTMVEYLDFDPNVDCK